MNGLPTPKLPWLVFVLWPSFTTFESRYLYGNVLWQWTHLPQPSTRLKYYAEVKWLRQQKSEITNLNPLCISWYPRKLDRIHEI